MGAGQFVIGELPAVHVKVTVAFELFHPFTLGGGDTEATIVGGFFSSLTVTEAVALFPARSVAVPLTGVVPSVETTTGPGQTAIPEPPLLSAQEKVTVTLDVFQPFPFGAGEADAVIVGAALSSFTLTVVEAELPALSVVVPETGVVPAAETVTGDGHVAMPDVASVQAKLTVTFALSQPLAFAGGEKLAVIVGAVLSSRTVAVAVAVFPALSVTVRATGVVPSVLTVTAEGQLTTPESESAQVKLTMTFDVFQPLLLGAGDAAGLIVGAVLSRFTVRLTSAHPPLVSVTCPVTT